MKPDGLFARLCRNTVFTSRLISLIVDEAHCVAIWAFFRNEYGHLGRIRYLLPDGLPVVAVSATLPENVLSDTIEKLRLRKGKTIIIRRSNDRPNVHIMVRKIQHTISSFRDLEFLVPDNWKCGDREPRKFVIFFDKISESVAAGLFLRARLPLDLRDKIKWFHSNMSQRFKEDEVKNLQSRGTWGICATDSFGMVSE